MKTVFIGSTSVDLKAYRQAAIDTCIELKFFPIAMEHFEAMGAGATEGSKSKVDEADLYVGIFAFRYGYVESGYERSVTEIEFDYAGERGLDRLCFLADPDGNWPPKFIDSNRERIDTFKAKIDQQLIRAQFKSVDEFKSRLMLALIKWRERNPDTKTEPFNEFSATQITTIADVTYLPDHFVGRTSLIAAARRQLDSGEHVLLQGLGGTGKTALSAAIVADCLRHEMTSVLWVKAGNGTATELCDALARAFPESRHKPIIKAADDAKFPALNKLLTSEGVQLLVLDDAWNGGAIEQLKQHIGREIPLLVSARQKFAGFNRLTVGNLEANPALELLQHHARREFTDKAAAEKLCQLVNNFAASIRFAGCMLDITDETPQELYTRIKQHPSLLEIKGDIDERHSFHALLDTTLQHLQETAPDALNILYAFGAFPTASTTKAMLTHYLAHAHPQIDLDEGLRTLRRYLLVEPQQRGAIDYYLVHDLVNDVMRRLFIERGADYAPVIHAIRDYVQAHRRDVAILGAEIQNIIGIAEIAAQQEQHELLLDIAYVLFIESYYFEARGYNPDPDSMQASDYSTGVLELLKAALAAATTLDRADAAHFLCTKLGNYYMNFAHDLEQALPIFEQARAWAEKIPNPHRQSIVLTVIGGLHLRLGHDDADTYFQQALELARDNNDKHATCFAMYYRGMKESQFNDDDATALQLFNGATQVAQSLLNNHTQPSPHLETVYLFALLNKGGSEHNLNRFEDAVNTHQQALAFANERNNDNWRARALLLLGEDYHEMGKPQQAEKHLNLARCLFQQAGIIGMFNYASSYMEEHNYAQIDCEDNNNDD